MCRCAGRDIVLEYQVHLELAHENEILEQITWWRMQLGGA